MPAASGPAATSNRPSAARISSWCCGFLPAKQGLGSLCLGGGSCSWQVPAHEEPSPRAWAVLAPPAPLGTTCPRMPGCRAVGRSAGGRARASGSIARGAVGTGGNSARPGDREGFIGVADVLFAGRHGQFLDRYRHRGGHLLANLAAQRSPPTDQGAPSHCSAHSTATLRRTRNSAERVATQIISVGARPPRGASGASTRCQRPLGTDPLGLEHTGALRLSEAAAFAADVDRTGVVVCSFQVRVGRR